MIGLLLLGCAHPAKALEAPSGPEARPDRPSGEAVPCPAPGAPVGLLVPAALPPGPDWNRLADGAARLKGRLAVAAGWPEGPGAHHSREAEAAILLLQERGGRVLGAVGAGWGNRPLREVRRDIATWHAWYPVDGIFFDEAAEARGAWFRERAADARRARRGVERATGRSVERPLVAFNTGRPAAPRSFGVPEESAVCFIEGFDPRGGGLEARGAGGRPESCYWRGGVGPEEWLDLLDRAAAHGFGWVYLTDSCPPQASGCRDRGTRAASAGGPWGGLPPYFEDLVERLARCHAGAGPAGTRP